MKSQLNKFLLRFFRYRSIVIKRSGKVFIVITIGVGVAALNSGNNLLYLLLSLLLSTIIVSGILSEQSVRGITVKRDMPNYSYRNKNSLFSYTIINKKRWASFLLSVVDICDGRECDTNIFLIKSDPMDKRHITYNILFTKRGLLKFEGSKISTSFPFGFIIKNITFMKEEEHIVYPEIRDVSEIIPSGIGKNNKDLSGKRGDGIDLYGLREFIEGDRLKFIHWKSFAKSRRLFVKEFEEEKEQKIEIHLVLKNEKSDIAENGITLSASLYHHLFILHIHPVFFFNGRVVSKRLGDYHGVMRYLALLNLDKPFPVASLPPYRKDISQIVVSDYFKRGHPYTLF